MVYRLESIFVFGSQFDVLCRGLGRGCAGGWAGLTLRDVWGVGAIVKGVSVASFNESRSGMSFGGRIHK